MSDQRKKEFGDQNTVFPCLKMSDDEFLISFLGFVVSSKHPWGEKIFSLGKNLKQIDEHFIVKEVCLRVYRRFDETRPKP